MNFNWSFNWREFVLPAAAGVGLGLYLSIINKHYPMPDWLVLSIMIGGGYGLGWAIAIWRKIK